MRIDPHDHGDRLPEHRKDEQAEALLAAANEVLATAALPTPPLEDEVENLPLVYVVGVPRSGTTLIHQLLARHLAVGYVDNIVARFWLRPSVGLAVSRTVADRTIDLTSTHGVTTGAGGPHEFGYFWRRWLSIDESPNHHLDERLRARVDVQGLRRQLRRELLAPTLRPFVFKNVICGFHARLLTQVHPHSLFVHVTRDPGASVRSILQARLDRYGSYDAWWSLKPSTYPFPASGPAEQVVRQVRDAQIDFIRELASPGVRSLALHYDDVCRDPRDALERVRGGIGELGYALPPPSGRVEPLRPSAGPRLPEKLERDVERRLGELLP